MVSIRLAAPEDFEFFYQLKCEPSNIFWTGFDTPPERTSFQKWYERIIPVSYTHLSLCIRHRAAQVGTFDLAARPSSVEAANFAGLFPRFGR